MGTAIRTGRGTRLALGIESTWGTEVTRTITTHLISTTLQRHVEDVPLQHLMGTTGTGRALADSYQSIERVTGETVVTACYQAGALGFLLQCALGSTVDAGAGPYTHTLTLSDAAPPSLSAELVRGMENGAADITEELYGLVTTDWELSAMPGKPVEMRSSWVGKTGGTRAAAGTIPAIGALFPILHRHAGTMAFAGNNYTLSSFKLKGANKQVTDLQELGSLYITEPAVGAFAEITVEAEVVLRSQQLYTDFLAGTAGDISLTFTDTTRSLAITVHNCKITAYDDGIADAGVLKAKVSWRAYSGSSESGASIVLTNAIATTALS